MTRWSKVGAISFFIFGFSCFVSSAQNDAPDIFDEAHSRIYAKHLFDLKRYGEAADEYSRLVKMSDDDSLKIMFLKSSRLTDGQMNRIQSVKTSFGEKSPRKIEEELIRFYLQAGAYNDAQKIIGSKPWFIKYSFQKLLLEKEWKKAGGLVVEKFLTSPENVDSQYVEILKKVQVLPHRSPPLAASMSVIVPGSGKVYAGEWKDGLIAFFFTAFSAYEAYQGFKIAGPQSKLGWIYAGVGLGFYTGSIYGSYKSARRFNNSHEEELLNDAKAIIFSTY